MLLGDTHVFKKTTTTPSETGTGADFGRGGGFKPQMFWCSLLNFSDSKKLSARKIEKTEKLKQNR